MFLIKDNLTKYLKLYRNISSNCIFRYKNLLNFTFRQINLAKLSFRQISIRQIVLHHIYFDKLYFSSIFFRQIVLFVKFISRQTVLFIKMTRDLKKHTKWHWILQKIYFIVRIVLHWPRASLTRPANGQLKSTLYPYINYNIPIPIWKAKYCSRVCS